MFRNKPLAGLMLSLLFFIACGPDTIFLRPSLDTPAQHVKNGHCLLNRGKIEAAHNEFLRAKGLDNRYAPAYVGIALIQGERGNVASGLQILEQARSLAATPEEINAVNQGVERLQGMLPSIQE